MHPAFTFGRVGVGDGYGLGAAGNLSPLAADVARAERPTCPGGAAIDPTGKFCTDAAKTSPAFGCPPDPPAGSSFQTFVYWPAYGVCFPNTFVGGDAPPADASCPVESWIYDRDSGFCLYPGLDLDHLPPGGRGAALPTCSPGTWSPAVKGCVAKEAPAPTEKSTSGVVIFGIVALAVAGTVAVAAATR